MESDIYWLQPKNYKVSDALLMMCCRYEKKNYLWKKNHKKQNPTLIAEATSIYTKKNHKKTKTSGNIPFPYISSVQVSSFST